jgi:hypothetical protein
MCQERTTRSLRRSDISPRVGQRFEGCGVKLRERRKPADSEGWLTLRDGSCGGPAPPLFGRAAGPERESWPRMMQACFACRVGVDQIGTGAALQPMRANVWARPPARPPAMQKFNTDSVTSPTTAATRCASARRIWASSMRAILRSAFDTLKAQYNRYAIISGPRLRSNLNGLHICLYRHHPSQFLLTAPTT